MPSSVENKTQITNIKDSKNINISLLRLKGKKTLVISSSFFVIQPNRHLLHVANACLNVANGTFAQTN